jgi:hypothetical protein
MTFAAKRLAAVFATRNMNVDAQAMSLFALVDTT